MGNFPTPRSTPPLREQNTIVFLIAKLLLRWGWTGKWAQFPFSKKTCKSSRSCCSLQGEVHVGLPLLAPPVPWSWEQSRELLSGAPPFLDWLLSPHQGLPLGEGRKEDGAWALPGQSLASGVVALETELFVLRETEERVKAEGRATDFLKLFVSVDQPVYLLCWPGHLTPCIWSSQTVAPLPV